MERIRRLNDAPVRRSGSYVLYWMTAARRRGWNFGLQRAVDYAARLERPLLVFEAVRLRYPHASKRLHRFLLEGMLDNARAFGDGLCSYLPFVEEVAGEGATLLDRLADDACVVVTDDSPIDFLSGIPGRVAPRLGVRLETADSNGLIPLRSSDRIWKTAHAFRRQLHRWLPEVLEAAPRPDPLAALPPRHSVQLPTAILERWPDTRRRLSLSDPLAGLGLDTVPRPTTTVGGTEAAVHALSRFVSTVLPRYGAGRNCPDDDAGSGISPYLHFGHLSTHQVLEAVAAAESWTIGHVDPDATGKRAGWWGMSEAAESFLDELVTWRELGYQSAATLGSAYATYEGLPDWARDTLEDHAHDPRPEVYSFEQLEGAETSDRLWNAAQTQLLRDGTIHGYLRMVWGKRILEWTRHPREAMDVMIALNDRWALDGRDPNSYTGIGWVLGRHDRPWGPERPIFGKVRYMSSQNTARKLRLREYLDRYAPLPSGGDRSTAKV
jgi:deoxyribodipyrimidine photo-lyase